MANNRIETTPALPLTPERLHYVAIEREDATTDAMIFFIIRLDPTGRPVKIEYTSSNHDAHNVKVITR